jgi:hypothetical protein
MPSFARFLLSLLLIPALLLIAANAALAQEDALLCARETARQEKLQAVPDRLLHAISLVESGRWDSEHKANLAWPWTVNAEGEGRFLPTKQAAINEVLKLRARGVRNIDVGCMQVNLLAHPEAFATLDEAFEPATNVAYAGRFLNDLYRQAGNWPQAAAFYHSQTPELAAPYKAHLLTVWNVMRNKGDSVVELASLDLGPQQHMPLGVLFSMEQPRTVSAPHTDSAAAKHPDPLGRSEQERIAAKAAADAFRQAKIAEYRQKKGLSAAS